MSKNKRMLIRNGGQCVTEGENVGKHSCKSKVIRGKDLRTRKD